MIDDERTYIDVLRDYECPDDCDFVDVLSEDEAVALFVSDPMLCPICDRELERSEESVRDLIAFVDESTSATPASTNPSQSRGPDKAESVYQSDELGSVQ